MIEGIYQAWQTWLMWACLGMLGVMAVGIILYGFGLAWGKVREWWSLPLIERVLAGVFVVGFAYYGSTKHGAPSVRWDDGLADNGTLITNDTVSVRWTYSGIPSASSVFIDYREAGSTNEWLNLAETLASAQEWTGTLANATNYDYWVYSTYVPPVPVHTNGVWVGQAYETKARVGAKSFLILNGLVQEHGRTIAPPKRRDLPYDSEVEYLESTGTQWIDTGMVLSSDGFAYDVDVTFASTANCQVFGGRTQAMNSSHDSIVLFVVSGCWRFDYFGDWKAGTAVAANTRYSVSYANGQTTVNGVSKSTPVSSGRQSGATVYVFAGHRPASTGGVEFPSSMKLYSLKFYQNGVLAADYQPVRKAGIGYLYDRVSGELFGNAGTGVFGYGSDK